MIALYLAAIVSIAVPPTDSEMDKLFGAMLVVEGNPTNKKVHEPNGTITQGPYCISRAYWDDAMEFSDYVVDYDKYVNNHEMCEAVMRLYFKRYKACTLEQMARIHNGGPRGMSKKSTEVYWAKVQEAMSND